MRPGQHPPVRMTHDGFLLRQPPRGVHSLTDAVTADADLFVVTHLGLAEVDPDRWSLEVGGLVQRPLSLTLHDIAGMPRTEVTSVHECAGSPLAPTEPKRRVGNVVWSGVRLAAVIGMAAPAAAADFVWSEGLEWGEFAGITGKPYMKDLPIQKAMAPEVLLATHMNGAPLTADRGGPVRLVVPGWYGTNSVKWLGRLTLATGRADSPFTTRFYNDLTPQGPRPVWGIAPESVIVTPDPDRPPMAGTEAPIRGWAWAEGGVAGVEVSVDGGRTWADAPLSSPAGFAWRSFEVAWTATPGTHLLLCRCLAADGTGQPEAGARNAIHAVEVTVPG